MGSYIFYHCGLVEAIAGIHEIKIFAVGYCYAFVHSVVYAFIGFAYPIIDSVGILPYYIHTAVGATAIYYDIFKIAASLIHNTFDGLPKPIAVVIVYGDD